MRVLAVINAIVWGGLAWIGWSLIQGVRERGIAGYPSDAQIRFYIYVPLVVLLIAALSVLLGRVARLTGVATTVLILSLVLVAPYLLFYTGGM